MNVSWMTQGGRKMLLAKQEIVSFERPLQQLLFQDVLNAGSRVVFRSSLSRLRDLAPHYDCVPRDGGRHAQDDDGGADVYQRLGTRHGLAGLCAHHDTLV